jgi:hypothetical protein
VHGRPIRGVTFIAPRSTGAVWRSAGQNPSLRARGPEGQRFFPTRLSASISGTALQPCRFSGPQVLWPSRLKSCGACSGHRRAQWRTALAHNQVTQRQIVCSDCYAICLGRLIRWLVHGVVEMSSANHFWRITCSARYRSGGLSQWPGVVVARRSASRL